MAYTAYANYIIYFTDQEEYDYAVAASGGNGFGHCPVTAAAMFGLPYPPPGGPLGDRGLQSIFPYSVATPTQVNHPNPSGVFLNPAVDYVDVPGQAGNPASIFPAGPDLHLVWWGLITKTGAGNGITPPETQAPIPARRWIGGLENEPFGEGGTTIPVGVGCRDSSRTIDGKGMAIRGQNMINYWSRLLNEYGGTPPQDSWERFYIRPRVAGSSNFGFWRCRGSISALAGAGLKLNTDFTISAFNINGVGTETLLFTTPALDPNLWYLIDVVFGFSSAPAESGYLYLYINHVLVDSATVTDGSGLDQNQAHFESRLGKWTGSTDNVIEMDIDDWLGADQPKVGGVFTPNSYDWMAGSHMRAVNVISASQVNWTPVNFEILNQGHNPAQELGGSLVSTTSAARIEGLTDQDDGSLDITGLNMGAVAVVVGMHSQNTPTGTDGELGVKIAGGADEKSVVNQITTPAWNTVLNPSSGALTQPRIVSPLSVVHTKSADGNTDTVRAVQAVVENIGTWGLEDDDSLWDPGLTRQFLHNCRYSNTMWGFFGAVPDAPIGVVGGTYTGNGLAQDILLPAPCHFMWIRPLTGGSAGGCKFFGASLGGHYGTTERVVPNFGVRVYVDGAGQARFRVSGTNAELNAAGVVYQYIAFCDPGMRFNICGAYCSPSALASDVKSLFDPTFLAEGGFLQKELLGNSSSNQGLSYKGPGHGASDGNFLAGTVINNWGSFGTGVLNTLVDVHYNTQAQVNYSLWRTTDPICGDVMVQILSYTGNATNPRNITLTPTSGRYPLFALVMPHNGVAYMRDPSHSGNDSTNVTNSSISTLAIQGGGIDQITVNSALNAAGVVYDVFVICGDTLGWNNGTFYSPNCIGNGWIKPPYNPQNLFTGNGGLILGGDSSSTLLKDVSGIYTLVPGKRNDTLVDRTPTPSSTIDVAIPNPRFKTGYIGG